MRLPVRVARCPMFHTAYDPNPPAVPPTFWHDFRSIWLFAFSRAVLLPVLVLLILLFALNQLATGFGAFAVIWKDPPAGAWWVDRAIVWNGFGIGLFILTMAYLVYLLFAYEYEQDHDRDDPPPDPAVHPAARRARLVVLLAVPPLVLVNLPVLLPWAFDPFRECDDGSYGLTVMRKRADFTGGVLAAVVAFAVAVDLVTRSGHAVSGAAKKQIETGLERRERHERPTVRQRVLMWFAARLLPDKTSAERQADGLFGFVLAVYAGLIGFTIPDGGAGPSWGPAVGTAGAVVVAAAAVWAWSFTRMKPDAGRRWVGIPAVVLFVLVVLSLSFRHWIGAGGGGAGLEGYSWVVTLGVGFAAWLVIRHLWRDAGAAVAVGYFAAAAFWAAAGGLAGYAAGWVVAAGGGTGVLPAPLSVCFLLGAVAVAYGVLRFYAGRWFYPTLVGVAAGVLLLASIRPYPHQIEELKGYYAWPPGPGGPRPERPELSEYYTYAGRSAGQLDDGAVLLEWRKLLRQSGKAAAAPGTPGPANPPLVVVTAAGGASTSAVYTFAVLTRLEKELPGFRRHVRVVSGASGGMFGATVYRAWVRAVDAAERAAGRPLKPEELDALTAAWRGALERDALSPIVQALAFKDVPMGVACPLGYWDDRGRRLERAWGRYLREGLDRGWADLRKLGTLPDDVMRRLAADETLRFDAVTFADLRDEEKTGAFPSLVFSPMMVEDGRPLYISTLDLGYLAVVEADDPYPSRTRGVEFFKLFPRDGWALRPGTAARLSAGFPFVSPAASLPTVPPRRLVDAGYYENYGMAVALGWIENLAESYDKSLSQITDRIVILELRPYGAWTDAALSAEEFRDREKAQATNQAYRGIPQFVWPLQGLTTPLEGGYAAGRTGMVTRNNDQFHLLQQQLGESVLENVVFKGHLDASLNWSLPKAQLDDVHRSVEEVFGGQEMNAVRAKINRKEWEGLKQIFSSLTPRAAPPAGR